MQHRREDPRGGLGELGDTSPEEFRRQLHELADWIADFREDIESLRVAPNDKPGAILAALPAEPPEQGEAVRQNSRATSIRSSFLVWCTGVIRCFSVTSAGRPRRLEFSAKSLARR